jgi:hypothetical protein
MIDVGMGQNLRVTPLKSVESAQRAMRAAPVKSISMQCRRPGTWKKIEKL